MSELKIGQKIDLVSQIKCGYITDSEFYQRQYICFDGYMYHPKFTISNHTYYMFNSEIKKLGTFIIKQLKCNPNA